MPRRKSNKLPLKPVLLWLVIGVLDVAGGSYLRGIVIIAVGVLAAVALATRSRYSTVRSDGADVFVRNFPGQEQRISKSSVINVRGGRGVSDLTCELVVLTPTKRRATRRVVVWAFRASQVDTLRLLCEAVLPETSSLEPSL